MMLIAYMMRWRRSGSGGEYERVMRDDNSRGLCSMCIVKQGVNVVVVRRTRDVPFKCVQCQTLVDERWMDGDGRSSLQSPVPVLKKMVIK